MRVILRGLCKDTKLNTGLRIIEVQKKMFEKRWGGAHGWARGLGVQMHVAGTFCGFAWRATEALKYDILRTVNEHEGALRAEKQGHICFSLLLSHVELR